MAYGLEEAVPGEIATTSGKAASIPGLTPEEMTAHNKAKPVVNGQRPIEAPTPLGNLHSMPDAVIE